MEMTQGEGGGKEGGKDLQTEQYGGVWKNEEGKQRGDLFWLSSGCHN